MSTTSPIPARTNVLVCGFILALHLLMLGALPFLLARSLWWALLIPAFAWANTTHWALIHEAIHKILHPNAKVNEWLGRSLSVLMGTSFHLLRFGHTMHHQLNRDWHSEWVRKDTRRNKLGYYFHLLFGLYGEEVTASSLLAMLPQDKAMALSRRTAFKDLPELASTGERFFYTRGNITPLRRDMAVAAIIYAAALWHFGPYWPVLLGFVAMRAVVISFLDNIYHYATPADNSKAGKELLVARPWSALMLHGHYHETHHLNPNVPWTKLPEAHAEQGRVFNGGFIPHAVMQFNGPLLRA